MKRFKRFLPTSFRRGSVLAYTLILLSVVLLAAIGIATVSVTNERGSLLSSRSVSSFQVADTGSQAAIVAIREELSSGGSKLNDLTIAGGGCSNSGGVATIVSASSGTPGKYTLTFYDKDENQLGCSDDLSQIATVKSVGEYRDTSRAVKVAVAAGTCTPGKLRVVSRNSSAAFTSTHSSEVSNFLSDKENFLVGARCSNYTVDAVRITVSGGNPWLYSNASSNESSFHCLSTGCEWLNSSGTASPCGGGWIIYGACAE